MGGGFIFINNLKDIFVLLVKNKELELENVNFYVKIKCKL